MGANDHPADYRLDILRAVGYDDAAELLSKLPEMPVREEQPPEAEQQETPSSGLNAADAARRAEGESLLDAMRASGIGQSWVSGGPA